MAEPFGSMREATRGHNFKADTPPIAMLLIAWVIIAATVAIPLSFLVGR